MKKKKGRQTDDIVRQAEEKFSQIFKTVPITVVISHLEDGKLLDVNPGFVVTTGYSREEAMGRTVGELRLWAKPEERKRMVERLKLHGEVLNQEMSFRRKDGTIRTGVHSTRLTLIDDKPCIIFAMQDINERKLAEAALRESEELYRTLVETSPDSIVMYALSGEILAANSQAARVYGVPSVAEFLSEVKTVSDLLAEESKAIATASLRRILMEGPSQKNEYLARIRGGKILPVEINTSVVRTATGEPRAFISMIRDITERKQAEKALRESEERWQFALEGPGDGVWDWNAQTNKVFFSHRWKEMLGFEEHEIGDTLDEWDKRVHPEDRERVYAEINSHFDGQTPLYVSEHRIQCKDGTYKWILDRGKVFSRTEEGKPLRVIGTHTDITERKLAEEALRESEARYRYLVTHAPAGIYEVDLTSRRFISANDVMCRLSGYTQEEFLSMDPMQLLTEESQGAFLQRVARVSSGEQVPDTVEFKVRGKRGREFCVLLNTRYSYEPGNRIKAMVVAHDITERKRAETERIELERRLLDAQRLESLGILAGGIAHDFNNLLMAILGNLDMTLLNLSSTSPARFSIEQAVQATRRATDLTRQLLAYSGKGRFMVTPMDLNELARENAELFRTVIHRTVTMNLRLTPERACIEADPGQVQQIIMNLITNASEAIGEKPGNISLSTGVQDCDEAYLNKSRLGEKPPAGKYVYLEVTDDGHGMNEETIQHIFDPFFTTKFMGRGLGMSAVLGIIRGHKGAIIVESAADQGTTIRVLFPIYETGSAESVGVSGTSRDVSAAAPFSGTVLVVDDEEIVRMVCADFLQHLGFQTVSAADGEDALTLLQKHPGEITLVLLDLTMPRMDGLRTFQEMKRLRPDIKVILCSGYSEQDATQRFTREGLAGFIQKPFRLQELKETIAGALKGSGPTSAAKT